MTVFTDAATVIYDISVQDIAPFGTVYVDVQVTSADVGPATDSATVQVFIGVTSVDVGPLYDSATVGMVITVGSEEVFVHPQLYFHAGQLTNKWTGVLHNRWVGVLAQQRWIGTLRGSDL